MVKYTKVKRGIFISRPNRFIAKVLVDGVVETVHVKNTGRCKELLIEGCDVVLYESDNPERKTKYDLVAVYKKVSDTESLLINMDSQIPNAVAEEWIKRSGMFGDTAEVKREVTFNNSRFDIFVSDRERKAFVEVKGVTLEKNGVAMFPDAPTERGIKHINELCLALSQGYEAYILFVVQMKGVDLFKPNDITHKAFGDALRSAHAQGVKIIAVDCFVTEDGIEADRGIKIDLN